MDNADHIDSEVKSLLRQTYLKSTDQERLNLIMNPDNKVKGEKRKGGLGIILVKRIMDEILNSESAKRHKYPQIDLSFNPNFTNA
jgi:hypothetical protein